MDISAAPINWIGESPDPEIVAKVRANIAEELGALSVASDLLFHHVSLTRDRHGPGVVLSGNAEISGFDAEYFEEFEPITFDIEDLSPEAREAIRKAEED